MGCVAACISGLSQRAQPLAGRRGGVRTACVRVVWGRVVFIRASCSRFRVGFALRARALHSCMLFRPLHLRELSRIRVGFALRARALHGCMLCRPLPYGSVCAQACPGNGSHLAFLSPASLVPTRRNRGRGLIVRARMAAPPTPVTPGVRPARDGIRGAIQPAVDPWILIERSRRGLTHRSFINHRDLRARQRCRQSRSRKPGNAHFTLFGRTFLQTPPKRCTARG